MKISETHKKFEGQFAGMNGRLTITKDDGTVVDVIYTRVQKARSFCEKNPESPEGMRFAAAVRIANGEAPADAVDATKVAAPPAPPILIGKNMENTALISANRKLDKLFAAAQEGLDAVEAIKTSRGNKYLNYCDDYKKALLAHFGKGE